ncbi:uncharacterized protein C8Q71DRAFT_2212 [Rhodofomes roseus]|uniref:Uncharacterized protein n=1 Tax=Rhodofomes roseus TaxID=34475 RepID=A0ABQ8KW26_9APHY|nr:uncharacterized protein C8Q71DRAFT_2212 [Rhodofomes roseus]KAH9843514.1 hypothetical protein C8Q71DRAFT_2212 [Rhodofomes roseus]
MAMGCTRSVHGMNSAVLYEEPEEPRHAGYHKTSCQVIVFARPQPPSGADDHMDEEDKAGSTMARCWQPRPARLVVDINGLQVALTVDMSCCIIMICVIQYECLCSLSYAGPGTQQGAAEVGGIDAYGTGEGHASSVSYPYTSGGLVHAMPLSALTQVFSGERDRLQVPRCAMLHIHALTVKSMMTYFCQFVLRARGGVRVM